MSEERNDQAETPQQNSRPPSQASSRAPESRPASQASRAPESRPASKASSRAPESTANSRAPSQSSQVSNKPQQSQSRPVSKASSRHSQSPSVSRPPPHARGRSRTTRTLSSASSDQGGEGGGSDEENRAPTPTADNPEPDELPDLDEEDGEGDNATKGKEQEGKKKRRRRGKKRFGVDAWPHGDNPGKMERPHGVDDWPYEDEEGEGVGTSGKVLQRPKGVRDFSPAYAPSDAGESVASTRSSVSGLSLNDWSNSSLPGVDNWPYGDNPGIMVKPLDHWGNPIKNPDGTLMQKENATGLPTYDELRGMDLDTHDDHVIKLKLEVDIDVAVEINARIHGDITLALLM